jgi:hypothetical protein
VKAHRITAHYQLIGNTAGVLACGERQTYLDFSLGPRAAPCGEPCPGGLPCPCPGQIAYQQALIAREGGLLGITLDDRFTSDTGRLEAEFPGGWKAPKVLLSVVF